jgi:hypothetical protein
VTAAPEPSADPGAATPPVAQPSRRSALGWTLAVIPVVATVATFGELTLQSFAAVLAAGTLLTALALRRRSGSAAERVGPLGLVWLAWLAVVSLWELATLLDAASLATLSDLMDPVLAHPALRGAATVVWAVCGWWLLRRPAGLGAAS